MDEGMHIANVEKDTTEATQHIRAVLELNTFLKDNAPKEMLYKGKYYEDYDHGAVPLITEYDAFRFIFDFYELKTEAQDFSDPESDFIGKIINHHIILSKEFKTEMKPSEEAINGLGHYFISIKHFEKAEEFLKLNVTNYPKSFNAYESLGDFYAVTGEKEKAIENYKSSIALNKDSLSKVKLIELENKDSISIERITELNAE